MGDLSVGNLLNGAGTVGLVIALGWALAVGWLSTKGQVTQLVALYTSRIADLERERDDWKAAAEASSAVARTCQAQVDTLLPAFSAVREGQRTVLAFMESLPKAARKDEVDT